jgi:fimbrial protein FimY
VLERQLTAKAMQQSLLDASAGEHEKEWFCRNEWPVLQYLSQGLSLREIANRQIVLTAGSFIV